MGFHDVVECIVELDDSEACDAAPGRCVCTRVDACEGFMQRIDCSTGIVVGGFGIVAVTVAGIVDEGEADESQGQDDQNEEDVEGDGVLELAAEGFVANMAGVRGRDRHDVTEQAVAVGTVV